MSEILSQINSLYLCRETQITQLYEYLNHFWPTILVYGSRGTGKTCVVKNLINKLNIFHVWINFLEVFNNKMIFENILFQLNAKNEEISGFQSNQNDIKCNSFSDFIENLKPILKQFVENNKNKSKQLSQSIYLSKCVFVFDSIEGNEQLFNTNNNELMNTFRKLQELTDNICPISSIFISRLSLESFCRIQCFPLSAIQINFNNYSAEEMSKILLNDCPLDYNQDFYSNYVNIILKTLTQLTRNLSEIRNFCLSNFPKYTEPITSGELNVKDSAKLYKRFQPILIQLMDKIPLKVVDKSVDTLELPDCVKYLLISAYLSSYNSVKTDKKFFVKNQGKKNDIKRRNNTIEEKECKGPKASSFERLFHIYKSILQLNAENRDDEHLSTVASNKLFAQIEELVSLKLVHKIQYSNKNNCLSSLTKYQISNSVTLEFIKELALKLNFNINAFME